MIIALASPAVAQSPEDGLVRMRRLTASAAEQGARIVCFPEAYLPGLRGQGFAVPLWPKAQHDAALAAVCAMAKEHQIAVIAGMELPTEDGPQIVAYVIDAAGEVQGMQAKTQLDPSEEAYYVPGSGRQLFEIEGMTFGVAICHEGWRYPETVRWAAVRGASVVFHPQLTGTLTPGVRLERWGATTNPYYEQAMLMRSRENTIYFASVNYAVPFQESATSLIDPDGRCQAALPYGEEAVLVQQIDLALATGLLARRFAPQRF